MVDRMKARVCVIVLLIAAFFRAYPLELGAEFRIGNLAFAADRVSTDTAFPGLAYPWSLSLNAAQPLSETFRFVGGFTMDPVLRNVTYAYFTYSEKYVTIDVGPFFGTFNTLTAIFEPGISTGVKLEFPGALFISFRSDSTMATQLLQAGDYMQERSDLQFGFYVMNAICSFGFENRKFTLQQNAATILEDELTQYSFNVDVFQKNVPYRIAVGITYQSLSKSWTTTSATTQAIINSLIIGAGLDVAFGNAVTITADIESNLYSFGQGQLLGGTAGNTYLFLLTTGVKVNIDSFAMPESPQ
jgi:hypothetical protein